MKSSSKSVPSETESRKAVDDLYVICGRERNDARDEVTAISHVRMVVDDLAYESQSRNFDSLKEFLLLIDVDRLPPFALRTLRLATNRIRFDDPQIDEFFVRCRERYRTLNPHEDSEKTIARVWGWT